MNDYKRIKSDEEVKKELTESRKLEEYFLWFCKSNQVYCSCSSDCKYYNVRDKDSCKKLYLNDYLLKIQNK